MALIEQGITKLKAVLEGSPEQNPPHDYSQQLCQKFEKALRDFINSTVLPSLSEKQGVPLLTEFVRMWGVYKVKARLLSQFFGYLDLYIMKRKGLQRLRLHEVSLFCFRDHACNLLNRRLREAVIALIDLERKGERVDRHLLKNVVDLFVEIGMGEKHFYARQFEEDLLKDTSRIMKNGWAIDVCLKSEKGEMHFYEHELEEDMLKSRKLLRIALRDLYNTILKPEECLKNEKGEMHFYEREFEEDKLKESAAYYSRKASKWIVKDSCEVYMLKVEECLKNEKQRVENYLHSSSEEKLVRIMQNELLVVSWLLEKCLDGDHKVEDVLRMYKLFEKFPKGLQQMANIFKQHVIEQGTALLQQHQSENENDVLINKLSELHKKYMAYAEDCFPENWLFPVAVEEAFEVFCNMDVSRAEVLAPFLGSIILPEEEGEFDHRDIESVMSQKRVTRNIAVKALKVHSGKIFRACSEIELVMSQTADTGNKAVKAKCHQLMH